jgi:3-deoxy-manno-octulosonate cytidylyltransferase (CMP-KDO synthetase)
VFHVVIPARYAASRLPGKPLADVCGRPLIQWVWERGRASGAASTVVATDDDRILTACRAFGADCLLTSAEHLSGTDRIAEVAARRGFAAEDIVVNLQGDEPLMPPAVVSQVAGALRARPETDIATAVAPIAALGEFLDPNCVKALRAADGHALYFSRAPVPWPRDRAPGGQPAAFAGAWRHVGIYAFRVRSLVEFSGWPATPLELTEKLEQLRALEHGMKIYLVPLSEAPPPGVDTLEELERVRDILCKN